ncbi:uncharacterized protein [Drosophila suzukii]|uniref:Integrase zinc-binding domain-containing protein n=1 Tax=Drosophila suzukii TaxID=28584 RepID=A0ABM4TXG3_DROSZ
MDQFKLLKAARSRAKASITRLLTASQDPRAGLEWELDEIQVSLERLNIVWKEFESISDQMVLFDEEEGYVDPAIDNERYEDKYLQASTLFRNLIRTCQESQENEREGNNFRQAGNPDEAASMASGVGNENLVRFLEQQQQLNERLAEQQATLLRANSAANVMHNELPKIHIKLFTGDYKEWPAFQNIFESTIHSKQHLTAIQKLHYLKTYITGEAADLIRHMPVTDAAYEAAWTCLIDRYNRPRHIVNTLLETFVNLPSTDRADVTVLRKVTDGATEIVRGLDAAGQTNRDCWIINFILVKIDAETRRKWIEGSRELESPSVDDLLKFLDRRCEEFELSKSESDIDSKVGPQHGKAKRSSHALVSMEANTCGKCNSKEHKIHTCSNLGMCHESVNPNSHASIATIVTTLCYMQIFLVRKPLSLRHTHEMMKDTSQTLLKMLPSPSAISHGHNGSELSYISERCVKAIGLARSPSRILVTGTSSIKAETTRGFTTLDLQSRISDHTMKVRAHVLSKITSTLARHVIAASALKAFAGFELADSDYQSLAPVDILLGSDYFWTVFTGQKMFDNQGNIIAISTIFGWEFHGNPKDDEVEEHFVMTHTRDSKGRYIVELPFKNSKEQFSDTLQGTLTRFRGVERRLKKDPNLHSQMFKFDFSADIVKMYRQIWVAANHCGYQRIVWREDETTPIKHYELSTVTYGTSCAPFLAVRVLDQLVHDHQHEFPTAAKILKEQFYVDDVLRGANTEEELIRNQNELIQLMKCAGMELENHGKEEVKTTALTAQESCSLSPIESLTQRVSSWTKLVRAVAYALRFIQKTKAIKSVTLANGKILTFEEIRAARILCLQEAHKCFMEYRKLLKENKPLHSRSQLVKLSPIICKDGLLRVGGRLDNSQLPADVKHPILLPKSNRITRMILEHEHTTNLHPGVSALFVIVRQKYWIFGARNLIRNLVHNCIKCFRQRKLTEHQFMSDLPGIRITEALPFQHSGSTARIPECQNAKLLVRKGERTTLEKPSGKSTDRTEDIGSDASRHHRQPRYHRRADLIGERKRVADVKH